MSVYDSFVKKSLKDLKYTNLDETKREVIHTISFWKGLKPVVQEFVFGNGMQKNLLALKGTIPINFRGSCYHIPVEFFLLDTHPNNAPIVYVRPTSSMRIRASRNVDNNGKVYHPILHTWKSDSKMMTLIQTLIKTFEEQPPVYAVSNQPAVSVQSMPTPNAAISSMPYPVQQTAYPMQQQQNSFPSPQTPYPTPYPPYPASVAMPMPAMPAYNNPQPPLFTQSSSSDTLTVTPAHIRASLISAMNEKLRQRLEDIYFSTQIEIKTGDELKERTAKLEEMMKLMDEEKATLEATVRELETELEQLNEKIDKHSEDSTETIVDDAIQAPAPLYKQIVNTFAEEAAVEDTIYYMSERFRNGKLDLEQFQKHLRILARKQFMLRAVLRKCRQKAGLAG